MTYLNIVKKGDLIKHIEELKAQIIIEADIRKIVEEFKHYKSVNVRFTNRLKEIGYHAYIGEQYGTRKLSVGKHNVYVELRFYTGEAFSWEGIVVKLDKCTFPAYLRQAEHRLAVLGDEIEELKKIWRYLNNVKLLNFDLWRYMNEINDCIRYSGIDEEASK